MTVMPVHRSRICCREFHGFFSSRRSGTTFTKAIYRNPPEVKGRIQATVSPAPFGDCAHIAKQAPTIPPRAVESCILAALQRSNPARSRIAKSPTSCGISCRRMAIVVRNPTFLLTRKLAATARPCVKLSMVLASKLRYPLILILLSVRLLLFL